MNRIQLWMPNDVLPAFSFSGFAPLSPENFQTDNADPFKGFTKDPP